MSNKSGVDLIKHLKSNDMMPKVFYFFSGYSDIDDNEAKALGAEGLLSKPFKVKDIIDELNIKLG